MTRSMTRYLQCFEYQDFVYIGIPKNALITHTSFFLDNGWKRVSFLDTIKSDRPRKYFSHIRCPHERHTKGLAEYLIRKLYPIFPEKIANEILSSENVCSEMLVSGVYDEHTAPISCLLDGNDIPIDWIPLDHPFYGSEDLTNGYFRKNALPFFIEKQRKHVSGNEKIIIQDAIRKIKRNSLSYNTVFSSCVLKKDLVLYDRVKNELNSDDASN